MTLSGNIKSIKSDDKTACFYFKRPNNSEIKITEPVVINESSKPKNTSNKIPDNTTNTKVDNPVFPIAPSEPIKIKNLYELDDNLYKPNNIVF